MNSVTPTPLLAPRDAGAVSAAPTHPKGLYYLAFTEAWERFSFYGMVALLSLYMVNQLLQPGHVQHVAGLESLRAVLESMVGPLSTQAFASQIFGLYSGFVYFTPVLGGLIADRWLGQRNAVVVGALAMSAGHLAMAFDRSFLLALLLLVTGSGLLKGNIASQVGALYPREDEPRRARGFVIFSTGINVGAVAGPLFCGWLAQRYGWHYGFAAAAVFMLVGLATYLQGFRHLPARVAREKRSAARRSFSETRVLRALVLLMLITVLQSVAYLQMFNVMPIWIEQHVEGVIGGVRIPPAWYQSVHALSSIVGVPFLFLFWLRQAHRGREPDDLGKIRLGAWMIAASNLILVAAILASGAGPVNPVWPLLSVITLGIAFLYYWPTLLALVSQVAPAQLSATLISAVYLTLFMSNILIGWVGGCYERLGPARFWALHAAIGAAGGVILLSFGRSLQAGLRGEQPP